MSISTQGGNERQPSTVKADKSTSAGKPPAGKAGPKPGGAKKPAGKGGGPKGRKITPVKVASTRNWGPIAVAGAVILVALGIIGFAVVYIVKDDSVNSSNWESEASKIDGVVNYRTNADKTLTDQGHAWGPLRYKVNPPVGGTHSYNWQTCMGNIYTAPIPNEQATHSLEHGAVWITYKQGLGADDVARLAALVKGQQYLFMSPVAGLDKNVSLQAWGYQLKLDTTDDERIKRFIKVMKTNASMEPGAPCSGGEDQTGTTPTDKGKPAGQ
jgi:hypothetical protein